MAESVPKVYQFKITLKDYKPNIWRRIQVPENYNFWELHNAIQDAMGWQNGHLHQFDIIDPKTGIVAKIGSKGDEYYGLGHIIRGKRANIADYFLSPKDKALYEYDFGDGWQHDVVLQRILPEKAGTQYPRCVAGKMACPPEDCGGTWGYERLQEILKNPQHEEYAERLEWFGGSFDPLKFDPKSVEFGSESIISEENYLSEDEDDDYDTDTDD